MITTNPQRQHRQLAVALAVSAIFNYALAAFILGMLSKDIWPGAPAQAQPAPAVTSERSNDE